MPEILKAQNKTMEGEPYFRTALYKEPYNYNVMLTLADYYWHTAKNSSKAMEYFKLAEIVMPYEPEIKYDMAFIDISNNKIEDAIELLKQCIKLSDSTPKYHRTLGTVYIFNNKPKEAIKEIRYAYGSDQEDILTLNNAGCYYISQEANLSKGEFNLRKAVEGITDKTDKETADMIRENYKRAKELLDKYNGGKSNQTLKIPDFQFFY
jgi:tetratricopeptide (TPR) repeat protein